MYAQHIVRLFLEMLKVPMINVLGYKIYANKIKIL